MLKTLKSQSGGALLVVVVMICFAMVALFNAAQVRFDALNRAVTEQRQRTVALQVMQDFAVLASRANSKFERCVGAVPACPASGATCPAGHTRMAGRRFCWSNGFAGECVRHPDPAVAQLCLSAAAQMAIAQSDTTNEVEDAVDLVPTGPLPEEGFIAMNWSERLRYAREFAALALEESKTWLSEKAYAQAVPEPYLPVLAGLPNANFNNITCNAGTAGNEFCKRCPAGGGGGVRMIECLTLRVCLRSGGCATADQWYLQRIGINDR